MGHLIARRDSPKSVVRIAANIVGAQSTATTLSVNRPAGAMSPTLAVGLLLR